MGSSSSEIARQIDDTREDLEEKIIALRARSEATMRRSAGIAAAVAGVAAIAVIGLVVYRVTRPPTARERIQRVLPEPLWRLKDTIELGWRRTIPPMRLYVGDRQVGEEPATSTAEKLVVMAARAAGTAAATALASRLIGQVSGRGRAK